MKLGGASAILPVPPLEEVVRFASVEGFNGAERRCGPRQSARYRRLFLPERREG
jgi:hypothetical protein